MMKQLEDFGNKMDTWYKEQTAFTRFFVNMGLMLLFLCLAILGVTAVGWILFWTVTSIFTVSPWFTILLFMEFAIPFAISFAIYQYGEEKHDPRYR